MASGGLERDGFDWRGQGRSRGDIVGGNVESFDPLIDDLAALIADWAAPNAGPHVAVGHSMGGHLLLRTIVERRPALDAAVLVAPMILPNSAPMPAWLAPDIADTMCRLGLRRPADLEDADRAEPARIAAPAFPHRLARAV